MGWIERRIRKEGGCTITLINEISSYLHDCEDPRLNEFNRNPLGYLRKYYRSLNPLLRMIKPPSTDFKWKRKIHLR